MAKQKPVATTGKTVDAINRFLASPPEGTPAEIIEAFDVLGTDEFLPPKLFLETVEQAPVAISITDSNARILYVNSQFEQLTGYHRNEVVGKNQSVLSSRITPNEIYRDLWQTIQASQVWRGTLVNHRKDHQEYLADLTISPVLTAQGETAYYLGMHRDVTELHQLHRRLKFQRALIEAALDSAPMVMAMIGADGRVMLDNHAYKVLMGDLRGIEPAKLILEVLQQQIDLEISSRQGSDKGFKNIEIRIDPPSGAAPRWFSCSGVHLANTDDTAESYFSTPDQEACCLLLIADEITASRQRINEAHLNLIRASMAEQQMAQTMSEAISGAIFKFREPLNIINAALAMPSDSGDQSGLRRILRQALETGNDAMTCLQGVLPGPPLENTSLININEILHEVLKLSTDSLLANGVVVDWCPTPVLPSISGRANALRGLFKYLLDNAIQAVNLSDRKYREIRLETRLNNQELLVEVVDSGPGMPQALRVKAFEPFFCGWPQTAGHAGMGLTMAQEVVNSHSGNIEIDPEFIGGCRVRVRLPVNGVGGRS